MKWKGGRYGYGQLLLAGSHLVLLTEEGHVVLVRDSAEMAGFRLRKSAP